MLEETLSTAPDARLEMLSTVEHGGTVAVRWRLTGTRPTGSINVAMMAIYEFVGGRIARDYGVWRTNPWH